MQEGNILLPDYAAAKKSKRSAFTPLTTPVVTDDRVVLIDFEYCSYNHRGFDLANHFCEWAFDYSNPEYPHFFATESNYPSDKQKRSFVREYLKQWAKQSLPDDGLNTEEQLLREADCYTLASHLLWTLWSIHNAFTSEITFGYWEYGKTRMDAYLRHKKRIEQEMNNNLTMST
jgi:choline/ethanolamine kinase